MDIELDLTGDIKVTTGFVAFTRGINAIRQHLEIRLKTFRGEWFLDERVGIPYFTDVFKKSPDQTVLNAIFTRTVTETPGVLQLNSLDFNLQNDTRKLEINLVATTSAGVLDFTVAGV